jgi:ankyrin repeat protein
MSQSELNSLHLEGSDTVSSNTDVADTTGNTPLASDTPLIAAIKRNDVGEIKTLVRAGVDTTCVNELGETALMIASRCSNWKTVRYLLRDQPTSLIDARDSKGRTALFIAIEHKKLQVASVLHDANADVTIASDVGLTPLMVCSDVDIGRRLLRLTEDCTPAFLHACARGDMKMVSMLLDHTENILVKDEHRMTSLLYACRGGHADVVELLLRQAPTEDDGHDKKDEANWENWLYAAHRTAQNALFLAVQNGDAQCVQALVDGGYDVHRVNSHNAPALHFAKTVDVARVLIDAGAKDIHDYDEMENTATSLACQDPSRIEVLRLLLESFSCSDRHEQPLLFDALHAGNHEAIRILVDVKPNGYINTRRRRIRYINTRSHFDGSTVLEEVSGC